MHRCYVAPDDWIDGGILLSADESRHLAGVLRAQVGDEVMAFDGTGRQCRARFAGLRGDRAVLTVIEDIGSTPFSVELVLAQALPKGKKMELIIEKATELGVGRIIPFISDRSIVRLAGDERVARSARWQRIAVSAAKQCGTTWVPDVAPVCDVAGAVSACAGADLFIVGSLQPDAIPFRDAMRERRGGVRRAAVMIGPEGDLTREEVAAAVSAGAIPVSFGELVLRVETAAIFGLSVLAYELGS